MSRTEKSQKKVSQSGSDNRKSPEQNETHSPQDILEAVRSGDVKSLKELLAREHKKRMPDVTASKISEENTARFIQQPGIEKELVEQIIEIASDNNITPDWVLLRALKVYVREYQRTGHL